MTDLRIRLVVQPVDSPSRRRPGFTVFEGLLRAFGVELRDGSLVLAKLPPPPETDVSNFFSVDLYLQSDFAWLLFARCEAAFKPGAPVITSWAFQAGVMGLWASSQAGPQDVIGSLSSSPVPAHNFIAGQAYCTAASNDPAAVVANNDHPAVCVRGGQDPLFAYFRNRFVYLAPLGALEEHSGNPLRLVIPTKG